MNVYTLYAVTINGTLIDGITSQSVGHGIQALVNHGDGSPYPRFAGIMKAEPTISFTSRALKKVLDVTGTDGVAISSSVVLFFQKTADQGLRASGGAHLKLTVSAGLVVPRNARAGQDAEAEISVDIIPVSSDGLTSPITYADSQSLSGSPNQNEKFTVGPASLNGTAYELQSIDIDFGLEVRTHMHSGLPYPVRAHIARAAPRITLTTFDLAKLATLGVPGVAQGSTDSVVWFRKLLENAVRTPDATAEHISFTIDDGHIYVDSADAGDNEDGSASIMVQPTYDGSNAVLVMDTTAAIS